MTHLLTNTSYGAEQSDAHNAPDHPVTSESSRRRWSPSSGHSSYRPTGTYSPRRIIRRAQTVQLSSTVLLELFQSSRLDSTPCLHSITTNCQGTLAQSEYPQHLGWLASQDMGPVLTMLALLALRAVLHSSGPRLTRHGIRANHVC